MATRTPKQLMQSAIEQLPANATVEDGMERLYLLAKIERGIEEADSGETLSHEEVGRRLGL